MKPLLSVLRSSRLMRHFSVYLTCQAVQKGVSFLLIPLFARYLTPEQFGLYGLYLVTASILGILLSLGLNESLYNECLRTEPETLRISSLLRAIGAVWALSTIALALIAAAVYSGFPMLPSPAAPDLLVPCLAIAVFSVPMQAANQYFQARQKPAAFMLLSLGWTLCFGLSSFLLVVLLGLEAAGWLAAGALSNLVFGVLAVFLLRGQGFSGFSRHALKECLRYALPVVPHNLNHWARLYLDRYLIALMVSTPAVGVYYAAATIANIITSLYEPFIAVNNPRLFKLLEENRDHDALPKALHLSIPLAACLVLPLSCFSPEIFHLLFPASYSKAGDLLPWMLAGMLALLVYYNMVTVVLYQRKSGSVLASTSLSTVLGILSNLVLLPWLGLPGAAISFYITNLGLALLIHARTRSVSRVRWPLLRSLFVTSFPILITQVPIWARDGVLWRSMSCVAFMALAMAMLWPFPFRSTARG